MYRSTFVAKHFENGANTSHDHDGLGRISAEDWAPAEWDGTVFNPSQMTNEELVAAICPGVDRVRGSRFYRLHPYSDNTDPTKAEVDEWRRIAINHVGALVAYTGEDRRVMKDRCMVARALRGDERKFTNNNAVLRATWRGDLMPNLYCDPSDPDCDPDNTGP